MYPIPALNTQFWGDLGLGGTGTCPKQIVQADRNEPNPHLIVRPTTSVVMTPGSLNVRLAWAVRI